MTGKKRDAIEILNRKIEYTLKYDKLLEVLPLSKRDLEYILWCAYKRLDTKNKCIDDIIDELSYRLYYW